MTRALRNVCVKYSRAVVACSPAALSALASLPKMRIKKEGAAAPAPAVTPAASAPAAPAAQQQQKKWWALSPTVPATDAVWTREAMDALADFAF